MATPGGKENITSLKMETPETLDEDNLSILSNSSFDSIDEMKLEKLAQYTCDECSSIPKIINIDSKSKTITIQCENHGIKTLNINTYLSNCLNYTINNWKCSTCDKVQRNNPEKFHFCQCGSAFCEQCIKMHQREKGHKSTMESDKFYKRCKCKKTQNLFDEDFIGYCHECHVHFCKKCKDDHKWHEQIALSDLFVEKEEIKKIEELNKEYKKLINFYESLIRLNKLIMYSYEKNKYNYYNLSNIKTIINNYDREEIVKSLNDFENKTIIPGENNSNLYNYMKKFHKYEMKEDTQRAEILDKYFNNFDLSVLAQMPLKQLRLLNLSNNSISQINYLQNCNLKNLVILNLNNNAIRDISIFENLKCNGIQALFLKNNGIKDISVFGKKKFTSLRQLDLRNNVIEDIIVFGSWDNYLKDLQSLLIAGNPFDPKNFQSTIEKIKQIMENEYNN